MKTKTIVISAVTAALIGIGALVSDGEPPAQTAIPRPTFYTPVPQPTVTKTVVQTVPTNKPKPEVTESAEDNVHTKIRVRPKIREPKVFRKWKRKFHW